MFESGATLLTLLSYLESEYDTWSCSSYLATMRKSLRKSEMPALIPTYH